MRIFFFLLICLYGFSCSQENINPSSRGEDPEAYDCSAIDSLFEPLGEPKPGEWLYEHEEKFQSLDEYISSNPRQPDENRKIIYIQPIGNFDTVSFRIIEKTASFFEAFFGLPVKINPTMADSVIPSGNRRINNETEQWQTKYILHDLLKPALPDDGIVMIALTDHDLYPDDDWNFVFGQATIKHGVGVWSYYRFGSPYYPDHAQLEFIKRVLRTAGHETCHMFSIKHCVSYNCLVNGSNSLTEADHKPLYLCPRCLEKLCWNLNMNPEEHMQRMAAFWHNEKIFHTAEFYKKSLKYLKQVDEKE